MGLEFSNLLRLLKYHSYCAGFPHTFCYFLIVSYFFRVIFADVLSHNTLGCGSFLVGSFMVAIGLTGYIHHYQTESHSFWLGVPILHG